MSTPLVKVDLLTTVIAVGLYNFFATSTAFLSAVEEMLFSTTRRSRASLGISVSGTFPSSVNGREINGFGLVIVIGFTVKLFLSSISQTKKPLQVPSP